MHGKLFYDCIVMHTFALHSYFVSGDEKALEKCENEITTCQRKIDELTKESNNIQEKINGLKEKLANAEVIYHKVWLLSTSAYITSEE